MQENDIIVVKTYENGEQDGIQLAENGQRLVDSNGKKFERLWHRISEDRSWTMVREAKMNLNVIKQILEYAFNKTEIQKYDVCQLWTYLGCDLLFDEDNEEYAYPVIGSLKFVDKINGQQQEYSYNPNDPYTDYHAAIFYYQNKKWSLIDFSTDHLSVKELSISSNNQFKIVETSIVETSIAKTVRIPIPELIGSTNTKDIDSKLHTLSPICEENENYLYEFKPSNRFVTIPQENKLELKELEETLGLEYED